MLTSKSNATGKAEGSDSGGGQAGLPSVSLPKGGGAVRSIGEKFGSNPVTGTGSMSVPLATSPGRSGFGPQLSLSYDSGAGNGPFGFGWSLSLPSITRKTDKGLPQYIESDFFILSGAEDLVPVLVKNGEWKPPIEQSRTLNGQAYRVHAYRPRIEGLFARIEHWISQTDVADTFWRSISKDNITTWYGKTHESRIADPAQPTRIFSWLICESYDSKGNVITYDYKQENSDGVALAQAHERNRTETRAANRYLKHIRYGNRTLIAWGDQLFRRETIESINEAVLLYVLAAEVLGPKPIKLPVQTVEPKTYSQAREGRFDALSNFEAENLFVFDDLPPGVGGPDVQPPDALPGGDVQFGEPVHAHVVTTWYFCIPPNDKLLGCWETVADRLFKIRHCMTIEGVVRQLPLFEPPIDPGLLVRAAAAGVDISSALNDINAALPHYRFNVMLQKASELCNDVKSLGAALLSALEKKDAEDLALLRSGHEIQLLTAVRQIKEKQIEEANDTLEGLNRARIVTEARRDYYRDIKKISDQEQLHMDELGKAHTLQQIAQGIQTSVSGGFMLPSFDIGTAGWAASPLVKVAFGGNNLGNAIQAAAGVLNMIAAEHTHDATMASIDGGYERRWKDWKFQEDLADKELDQIKKQEAAAEVRKAIAEKDLENHDKQIENTKEVDEYMRSKFTNQELYNWMVGQISSIYFQSYQLAYDVAKRAERTYRHELGLEDSGFIQFGYWDSLKNGLLAGEKLYYDIKRMEMAHLDQNKREYEITKHISLEMLDPIALVKLKETGECFVSLPEVLFDLDYPGHYMRRIKSVSLTIPCVTGPYTSVNCTLTVHGNRMRKETSTTGGYAYTGPEDTRFRHNVGAIQSIVTSSGQNDSGVFELNFRDERYLPFEGAGAISDWRIELVEDFRQFDYDTISDVILHVRYTARDGGDALKHAAATELQDAINQMVLAEERTGLFRLFSLRHEFPSKWHHFLNPPADGAEDQTLTLALTKDRFPFLFQNKTIIISTIELFVKVKPEFAGTHNETTVKLTIATGNSAPTSANHQPDDLLSLASWNGLLREEKTFNQSPGNWTINVWRHDGNGPSRLDPNAIENILVICHYTWS